ncbi:MAG TPA: GNAT family N-acetyltransferase [Polyangia bacterium]|jgi:GNAT superfamily N-acetyltransferase|nr:GNAT family N-acetyltransferase [Polyangia bacterium]
MTVDAISIRPAREDDCDVVERLAHELNVHEGLPLVAVAGWVRRDVLGAEPKFHLLVGERAGEIIGYALYTQTYNTDYATIGLWLEDLYVLEVERRQGAGRRLLAAVAAEAVRRGAASVMWGVRATNTRALAFYASIGAKDPNLKLLELSGPKLAALADTSKVTS